MLKVGSVVDGKYKIIHKVGTGGTSVVWLALNEKLNQEWAIKEIQKTGIYNDEKVSHSMIAETRILTRLRHEHLPRIIDVFETEDTYQVLMDFIPGIPLSQVLQEEGAQDQDDVVKWAIELAEVLQYLHSQKPPIIYRDMKPANIMLNRDNGDVTLIDFGTAREYDDSGANDTQWLGTKGYAAPEQYGHHGQTDERTDIYNIGATMYHLLTGHNPSKPPYEMYPIRKWNRNLSSGLETIVLKCTRNDPDSRYQNCAELIYALKHFRDLDEDKRRIQDAKLRVFISSIVMSVIMVAGGITSLIQSERMLDNTYQRLLHASSIATSKEVQREDLKKAISVDPEKGEAYTKLMDLYLSDNDFSTQESNELAAVLGTRPQGSSKTFEEMFHRKEAEYDRFAYETGLAYFYYYETKGNPQLSRGWFETAANSEYLEDSKKKRSQIFLQIADYYRLQTSMDKAGDAGTDYAALWEKWNQLLSEDIVEEDNLRTALVTYREASFQIGTHAKDFRDAGIAQNDLENALTQMDSFTSAADLTEQTDNALVSQIKENIAYAGDTVKLVYQKGDAHE